MYVSSYEDQYLSLVSILWGWPKKIARSHLSKILGDLSVTVMDLLQEDDEAVLFVADGVSFTRSDVFNTPIALGGIGSNGYIPYQRLSRLLLTRKYRWLVEPGLTVPAQTDVMEIARVGFSEITASTTSSTSGHDA